MVLTYDYTKKLMDASLLNNITGSYSTSVSANHISWKERCCFKCGLNMTFSSPVFKDFQYATNVTLTNIPFGSQWYTPQKAIYSGQQFLTTKETLTIPENSIIPNNSLIKAAGIITIEKNVTIGSGTQIISGVRIVTKNPNIFWPKVVLKIESANQILFNCADYNFSNLHHTSTEINQFCSTSTAYQNKVYASSILPQLDSTFVADFDFRIAPNPNQGEFSIMCNKKTIENGVLIMYDIQGRKVYQKLIESGQNMFKVSTANLNDGIYFVKLTAGKVQFMSKVIIQQ
jgi:hypothetical protein